MFEVGGRKVRVVTGKQTQTVNVCTEAGRLGEYEVVVRLRGPFTSEPQLSAARFGSINALVTHLTRDLNGEVEGARSAGVATAASRGPRPRLTCDVTAPRTPLPNAALSEWGLRARSATESAIDVLVREFIAHPYLHRVEHSIHCRLFELMSGRDPLADALRLGRWTTQPIHKEWPEYHPRPEKGNRRGNFDLAVLAPEDVSRSGLAEFRNGTIRPSIVIEIGLDYRHDHLLGDVHKLRNSGISDSYLIHLVREGVPDDYASVERTLIGCGFKTAYVRHAGDRVRYKLVGDTTIREMSVQPG